MCGYSTTWYPTCDVTSCADTTAWIPVSPARTAAGGLTVNVVVTCSSGRSNLTGADAGTTVHPAGTCIDVVAFTGPFVLLPTVTTTERARALAARTVAAVAGRPFCSFFLFFFFFVVLLSDFWTKAIAGGIFTPDRG